MLPGFNKAEGKMSPNVTVAFCFLGLAIIIGGRAFFDILHRANLKRLTTSRNDDLEHQYTRLIIGEILITVLFLLVSIIFAFKTDIIFH